MNARLLCGLLPLLLSALPTACQHTVSSSAASSSTVASNSGAATAPAYLHETLCYVDSVAPSVRTDLKYAGCDNFVGRPIDGYTGHRAVLRREAAAALARVAESLRPQGLGLLIWDAYRPRRAMKDFRAWSETPDDRMKAKFYPNISKAGIYEGRYIGDESEHSWGIAVDITLVHLKSGRPLDMGGHHDLLDPSSATLCDKLSPKQQANRLKLKTAMEAAGFRNYSKEWWHYYYMDVPQLYSYDAPLDDTLLQR